MKALANMPKVGMALYLAGLVATVAPFVGPAQAESLTIGAAYSLKPAFQEIVPIFEREYGAAVKVVYGPSQTLRREIEQGAAIDVFLPAAAEEIEKLQKKGLTLGEGARIYGQTSLVLVMSAASRATPVSFRDVSLNRAFRIALGDPKTSGLGDITARTLTRVDPAYKNRFQAVYAKHSEEIVNLIHRGEADAGILYRVDAINSGDVRIIDESPAGSHRPVYFGQAVVWTCRTESFVVAEEFLDFMMSPRIQKLLLKYGFEPMPVLGAGDGGRRAAP
ncbi:MAG: molybdate ABC transporter substrate-binding protein [Nitrospirota bacterium]